jgi:hypothetical protein
MQRNRNALIENGEAIIRSDYTSRAGAVKAERPRGGAGTVK